MATETEREAIAPWYLRGKTLIISVGALAAAGLAILGLWDRIFPADLADVATIESVDMLGQVSLHDFVSDSTNFQLGPAPGAAAREPSVIIDIAATEPEESAVPTSAPPPADGTPSTSATATPSTPATMPPTTTPPPSPGSGSSPTDPVGQGRWSPSEDYVDDVVTDPILGPFIPGDIRMLARGQIGPTEPGGEELPAPELAKRLADALSAAETIADDSGSSNPQGWTVAVNLTLEGLAGVPLLLTWSLDGVDVPEGWAADNVAYRVVATTPRDSGSAEVWVPNLKAEGVYRVNVKLAFESDGTPIARGEPLELPIP